MTLAGACPLCGGRGSRVVAAICRNVWVEGGVPCYSSDSVVPVIAPCRCAAERAARALPLVPA